MKHCYLKWKTRFLILLAFLSGIDFTALAFQNTFILQNRDGNPITDYKFKIQPLNAEITTDENGTFTCDFPDSGIYNIIPEYWESSAGNLTADEYMTDASIVHLECGSVATFAINGLEPPMYDEISSITCNGRTVTPKWDANGKFRYLVESTTLYYNATLPTGDFTDLISDFTQDIVLTVDIAGKQKTTFNITDINGAPLQNAQVYLEKGSDLEQIGNTDDEGKVSGYIFPGEYMVSVSKEQGNSHICYGKLKQRISVTDELSIFNISYQGNSAVINISAKGYDGNPLGGVYVNFYNGNSHSSVNTSEEKNILYIVATFGVIEYTVSTVNYAKKLNGTMTIALNEQKNLNLDYSDCKRILVDFTDIPQDLRTMGGLLQIYPSDYIQDANEIGYQRFNIDISNPDYSSLPSLYIAPGDYQFRLSQMEVYTHSEESAYIYPIEKDVQITNAQTIMYSLQGLHKVDFKLDSKEFQLNGLTFYKDNKQTFSTYKYNTNPTVYMKDGQYSWIPKVSDPNNGFYAFPIQTFIIEGADKTEIWNISAYHRATFSFAGTKDGADCGLFNIKIKGENINLQSGLIDLKAGNTKTFFLLDGNYSYTADLDHYPWEETGNSYIAPPLKGDLRINGSDIEETLSYLDYTPVTVDINKPETIIPSYYFEAKNNDGKRILTGGVSYSHFTAYLLPGTYQFIATAPLCSTAKENRTITASATNVDLILTDSNNICVLLHFYDEAGENLPDVKVEVGGYEAQYTDEFGLCSYFDVPIGETLKVKATKHGHETIESNILIETDDLEDASTGIYREFEMISNTTRFDNIEIENSAYIYPNPVASSFKVRLPENAQPSIWTLSIYDLNGCRILTKNIINGNEPIDVSALSSGIYMVRLQERTQTLQGKLIKR